MKVIKTIKDKILFAYQLVAAITLVVLIAAAAIQVVTRYVIAQPPGWTDELARFAFVWCSALGAVVALDKGMHAGITLLEEKLPELILGKNESIDGIRENLNLFSLRWRRWWASRAYPW